MLSLSFVIDRPFRSFLTLAHLLLLRTDDVIQMSDKQSNWLLIETPENEKSPVSLDILNSWFLAQAHIWHIYHGAWGVCWYLFSFFAEFVWRSQLRNAWPWRSLLIAPRPEMRLEETLSWLWLIPAVCCLGLRQYALFCLPVISLY